MCKKNIILNKILTKSFFIKNDYFLKIENKNLFVKKEWVGFKLAVHNGKYFIPIVIKESMIGKLLGSLVFSKKILLKTKKKFKK